MLRRQKKSKERERERERDGVEIQCWRLRYAYTFINYPSSVSDDSCDYCVVLLLLLGVGMARFSTVFTLCVHARSEKKDHFIRSIPLPHGFLCVLLHVFSFFLALALSLACYSIEKKELI